MKTLEAASGDGWHVIGAALDESVAPEELDAARPSVLVLGSEGHGLRTMVQRTCETLVRVPGGGGAAPDAELVDSLNVSVAGAILLYTMLSARR